MLTYNKVQVITRLTRDVEVRVLQNGKKLAKLGCVVDGPSKKNNDTGQWESEPCWLDVEVWDRGENGRMASLCEERLSKGSMVFIEAKLKMDAWTGRDGQKRNKLVLVAEEIRFLDQGQPEPRREEHQTEAVPGTQDLFGSIPKDEIPF